LFDQRFAYRIEGPSHGVGFFLVIGTFAQVVRWDLDDQVEEGGGLVAGEVELES